jgi:hypothetical protein
MSTPWAVRDAEPMLHTPAPVDGERSALGSGTITHVKPTRWTGDSRGQKYNMVVVYTLAGQESNHVPLIRGKNREFSLQSYWDYSLRIKT